LQSHEASVVAKALMSVFSHFGFPDKILSDRGPALLSKVIKIFLKEFGIRYVKPVHFILSAMEAKKVSMVH
jgi:hypothetical protein